MIRLLDLRRRWEALLTVASDVRGAFRRAVWWRSSANARAMALLREHLSPEQFIQLGQRGFFDVVGCDTGRRYRIHYRRTANVEEFSGDGRRHCSWCFHPRGNLPIGDVMLAQKIALEVFEQEALDVANMLGPDGRPRGIAYCT